MCLCCVRGGLNARDWNVLKCEPVQSHTEYVSALPCCCRCSHCSPTTRRPQRADAAVIVGAQQDAYVSPQSVLELQQHLTGSEVRWVFFRYDCIQPTLYICIRTTLAGQRLSLQRP